MSDELADELARADWRKAAKSGSNGGNCLEVARLSGGRVGIRDSEAPERAPFVVRDAVWEAFVDGVKKGEFDF
ncbi:DUF397 domain-containing protein [Nonomuraea candida]|uniref:DUF397 domain-containing protein n=1 Tax=Nonomuraea candida TaxID=359159 RepID=UPI0005BE157F|nr:DUF397 domain-containing protein [Nonomuraea candida]